MRNYELTLKDKIYLFFEEDIVKRKVYLFPKVKENQLNWFNERRIRIPLNFDRYIYNYVDCLISDYDLKK